eukprot:scaffold1170_cov174-Amphora_coffeaeformis.AAC.45
MAGGDANMGGYAKPFKNLLFLEWPISSGKRKDFEDRAAVVSLDPKPWSIGLVTFVAGHCGFLTGAGVVISYFKSREAGGKMYERVGDAQMED